MRNIVLALCLAMLPLQAFAAEDMVIIPGERVGSITRDTSEADITKQLKPGEYKRDIVNVGDGFGRRALTLYPGTPKEIAITWKSDKQEIPSSDWATAWSAPVEFRHPDFVTVVAAHSPWHTADGISTGTPLSQLRRINQSDFVFAGFDWAFPGRIYSWNDGAISTCLGVSIAVRDAAKIKGLPTGADDVHADSDIVKKYAKQMYVGTLFAAFPDVYGGRCN